MTDAHSVAATPGRSLRTGRAAVLGVAFVTGLFIAAVPGKARADAFDRQALVHNATDLVTQWPRLFSPAELARLRVALRVGSVTAIEAILQPKVQIEIAVNPEARVSARLVQHSEPVERCGAYAPWMIRVSNSGYVTAPLLVQSSQSPRAGLEVRSTPASLTGGDIEYRVIELATTAPGPTEATLLFSVGVGFARPGRQIRIPVLLTCRSH